VFAQCLRFQLVQPLETAAMPLRLFAQGLCAGVVMQLLGIFDDFGYSQIGIGCRLLDEVCEMSGLGSAGRGFTIVRGSGLPRLTVIGFNRRVDWPTLVERLMAVGSGDVKPVVD